MNFARTVQLELQALHKGGEKPALIAFGRSEVQSWSFRKLADRAQAFANGLAGSGIKRGDTVALFAENRPEWIAMAIGVIRAGAVVLPIDVQFGDQTLVHVLDDSRARFLVTTYRRVDRVEKLPLREKPIVILLDAPPEDQRGWERWLREEDREFPTVQPNDPVVMFYTSGTTGPPKGVPLSHGNVISQLDSLAAMKIATAVDRVLLPLPLHHVYPLVVGVLLPLTIGVPLVLPFSLSGQQLLRALREGEVTIIAGVPRLYSALYAGICARVETSGAVARRLFKVFLATSALTQKYLRLRIGKLLFHSLHQRFGEKLRLFASGGSALNPKLASNLEALGWELAIAYGLTETSPILSINLPGEGTPGSAGKTFPGVEIRIDSHALEKAERVRGHEVGEILARGPNVFTGYLNLPRETAEVFTSDGWFRTGDMGYFDDRGCLFILGRISTLIVTESGEKVQTEDLETAYSEPAAIREVGVLQEEGKLVALIVPERSECDTDATGAIREAMEVVSRQLPSYERISDYAITLEALPRTRLGKIKRHQLTRCYKEAKEAGKKTFVPGPIPLEELSEEDHALLEDGAAHATWDFLARRHRDKRLTPDTSLQFDLGIDSLEWLNLSLEVAESSGVELTEDAIGRVETVRDLLREITEAREGEPIDPLTQPDAILNEEQKRWLQPLGPVSVATTRCLYGINRVLMRALFGIRTDGIKHLPGDKHWVLVPNHVSYLDPFAIAAALDWSQLRETYWAGWTDIVLANRVMRFLSRLGKILPIEPTRAARSSLAFGAIILDAKKNLVWFPEGERSISGELVEFKPGVGMLLERFPATIIPVLISGSHAAWPPTQRFPRRHPIRVVFGEPLSAGQLQHMGRGERPHERITSALRDQVAAMAQASDNRRDQRTVNPKQFTTSA